MKTTNDDENLRQSIAIQSMPNDRYIRIMQEEEELTPDDIAEGWHFCHDFDGLLVGPGMGERAHCHCFDDTAPQT